MSWLKKKKKREKIGIYLLVFVQNIKNIQYRKETSDSSGLWRGELGEVKKLACFLECLLVIFD